MSGYEVMRIDDVPSIGTWQPLRRRLGISAFGINAWTGDNGTDVIPAHDEKPTGHEELYLVLAGRATFTVADDSFDGEAGTIVFVSDPELVRGAVAKEAGTRILTVGATRGEAYRPRSWETNAEVFPLFEEGRFAEAKERLEAAVSEFPDEGGVLYNLACAEARLGEREQALDHLTRAVELEERFREPAQTDPDLESIRDDARFPAAG
jgi:tetratricopeptide (TPR) repeat protein